VCIYISLPQCFDKGTLSNDFIGSASIPLSNLRQGTNAYQLVDLRDVNRCVCECKCDFVSSFT
jgi:hypothetical protein